MIVLLVAVFVLVVAIAVAVWVTWGRMRRVVVSEEIADSTTTEEAAVSEPSEPKPEPEPPALTNVPLFTPIDALRAGRPRRK